MELPEKLMRMATQKRAHKEFGYVTYQVILFFDNGERLGGVNITMERKPFTQRELEREIMDGYNKQPSVGHKVVKVHVFRNCTDGGILIRQERVIYV